MISSSSGLFGRVQMKHLSMTNLIQWGDHFSVGIPEIDAQHKAIFDLGTRIYEKWRAGVGVVALRPFVDKLASLLPAHFSYEERRLAEAGYVDLDQHVAEHRSMLKDFAVIRERFHALDDGREVRGGSLLAPGWPIMQFFLEFTVGHVMNGDMSYSQALAGSHGKAQAAA
jgi:hemerythrin-like metal-binding protein